MGNIIHMATIQMQPVFWLVLFDHSFTILYPPPHIMLLFYHVKSPLNEFPKTYLIIFQMLDLICFKFMKYKSSWINLCLHLGLQLTFEQ